jgi:drug/metabolite transporter (DMT)-like permease
VILVGHFSRQIDVLQFSIGQFVVCGLLNLVAALTTNFSDVGGFAYAWQAVIYSAVFSITIGFTLQAVGQKHAKASDAAIILSLEAVFGALFGYLILHETLTGQQIAGCALMLAAMILSQVKGSLPEGETLPVSVETGAGS